MQSTQILIDAVNKAWIDRYGGVPIDSPELLATRVRAIATDRDCWLGNAKRSEAEAKKNRRGSWDYWVLAFLVLLLSVAVFSLLAAEPACVTAELVRV